MSPLNSGQGAGDVDNEQNLLLLLLLLLLLRGACAGQAAMGIVI